MALPGSWKVALCGLLAPMLVTGCKASDEIQSKAAAADHIDLRAELETQAGLSQDAPPLDRGISVVATATALAVQDYLNSKEPAGRRFRLPSISFDGDVVKVDPPGAISTLVILLRSNPSTRIRVEVLCARDHTSLQSGALQAERLKQVFVDRGYPAERITSVAMASTGAGLPKARLVILSK